MCGALFSSCLTDLLAADDDEAAAGADRPGLDLVGVAAFLVGLTVAVSWLRGDFLVGSGEFRPLPADLAVVLLLAVDLDSVDLVEALEGVRDRSLLLDATELVGDFLIGREEGTTVSTGHSDKVKFNVRFKRE